MMGEGGRARGGRDPKGPGWLYSKVVAQDRVKGWARRTFRGGWITEFAIWRFVWLALYPQ